MTRRQKLKLRGSLANVSLTLLLMLVLGAVGCGGPKLGTVKGVVTLDGIPLEGGSVTFIPEAGGPLAYSSIASDGAYELQAASSEGIAPGKYVATVSYRRGRPSPTMTVAEIQSLEMVPVRYTTQATSNLKRDVASGANEVNLELTSSS